MQTELVVPDSVSYSTESACKAPDMSSGGRDESHSVWKEWLGIVIPTAVAATVIFVLTGLTSEQWVDQPTPKADSLKWRVAVTFADTAVLVLAVTLSVGPLRVLRGRRATVHLPRRRRLGITAAVLGLAHLSVALDVHGDWSRPHRSFVTGWPTTSDPVPMTFSYLVAANWLGLAIALVLLVLWAISNRTALQRWGARRWKRWQRLTYVAAGAIVVHAVLFQRVEQRALVHRVLLLGTFGVVLLAQAAGFVAVRRRRFAETSDAI